METTIPCLDSVTVDSASHSLGNQMNGNVIDAIRWRRRTSFPLAGKSDEWKHYGVIADFCEFGYDFPLAGKSDEWKP